MRLSEDEHSISQAAESFVRQQFSAAASRAAAASPARYDRDLWRQMAQDLGWCGIAVAEEHGGLGLGPVAISEVLQHLGKQLAPTPFLATGALATALLNSLATPEAQAQCLPRLAVGDCLLSVELPNSGLGEANGLHARFEDSQWWLSGPVQRVLWAVGSEGFLLAAAVPEEATPALFLLPCDWQKICVEPLTTWDDSRCTAHLSLADAGVPAQRLSAVLSAAQWQSATAYARLYLAAEALGAAQQCLDLTVDYTLNRKQFGRVIAGFQAVKHRAAEMMVRIEALRSAVSGAAHALQNQAHNAHYDCSIARLLSQSTAFYCAQESIQLHGGVGFTWEFEPQRYFKRAQSDRTWLGDESLLQNQLAAALLAGESTHALNAADAPLADFRAEVAGWMHKHLQGDFAALKYRGGPGDEEADPALRKRWEQTMAQGGWVGAAWPQAYGGRGLSMDQHVVFCEEYARAGGPGRMGHIGEGLVGPTLIAYGTAAQQAEFLPGILAGTQYWAQGYSEPNAGSDLANVQTRCWQREDGSWRVQGQKIWTSLAHESDWVFVLARSQPGSVGNKGLSFLLLPLAQAGITIKPIRQMGGGAEFNEVFFDQAVAQAGHLVGAPGEGWKVAMGLLEVERGASTLGQQMHFVHEFNLVLQAAQRSGSASNPQIRARLAQAWCGLKVMRANALRMLANDDAASGLRREALIYKYYWSNWHRDLGKLAMDVLGPDAEVISDNPVTRPLQQLFFFSPADTIYGGTNEIQLNLIAERGLNMPREARPKA